MNNAKTISDFKETIENMKLNIKLYKEGNLSTYRVVAIQLRVLLCDEKPLLSRIFKDIKLHPIRGNLNNLPEELKNKITFMMPARVNFNGKGGSEIVALFAETKTPIDLDDWVKQMLFNKDITIYTFIKSVADKEAAHSDEDYNRALKLTKSVSFPKEDVCRAFIVAIGEYIVKIIPST